jgi:hypothetical protein
MYHGPWDIFLRKMSAAVVLRDLQVDTTYLPTLRESVQTEAFLAETEPQRLVETGCGLWEGG